MAAIVANCAISLNCELTQPVKVQYIDGNMFSMDNAGNTAHVYVFYNGEPQEIVGSVSADVIRSDGTTVSITGAMSGNRAYVIFPQSCYAVPGVVSVVIKVTEGSTVTTIAAFVANVYRSSTDAIVDPGTIIPSVQNLISAIETAVASIPADYSSLWESLAPDYTNITFPVTAGKYCTYNGTLYIAKVDIATTESFTAAHWQSTNIGDDLSALKSAFHYYALSGSDLESGGIEDGTGKETITSGRVRTKGYYPVGKGTVIEGTIQFNIFEYDLVTHEYAYSTSGWKTSYVVHDDSAIRVSFNNANSYTFDHLAERISLLSFYARPFIYDNEHIIEIVSDKADLIDAKNIKNGVVTLKKLTSEVVEQSRNIANVPVYNGRMNNNGEFIEVTTGKSQASTKDYIPVEGGYDYSISYDTVSNNTFMYVYQYTSGKVFISTTSWKLNTGAKTIKLENNAAYIRFMFYLDQADWTTLEPGHLQIEKSIIPTKYVPTYIIKGDAIDFSSLDFNYGKFENPLVTSIAHRGDMVLAPQCTAPAYIIARREGFTIAENDLAVSSDGEFVMWHDTTLARLGTYLFSTNGRYLYTNNGSYYWYDSVNGVVYEADNTTVSTASVSSLTQCASASYGVEDLPYSILSKIDFGKYKSPEFTGTTILKFSEWVMLCKKLGMEIYIDKKITITAENVASLVSIVRRAGMLDNATWANIGIAEMNLVRTQDPNARGAYFGTINNDVITGFANLNSSGRGIVFDPDGSTVTLEQAQLALDNGYQFECWYVGESLTKSQIYSAIPTLVGYGAQAITIDHYRVEDICIDDLT